MIKVIATVGTSVITNFMDKDVIKAIPNGKKEDANIADLYDSILQTPNDRNAGKLKEKIEKYFLFNMQKENGTKNWKYSEQKGDVNLHCSAEVYSISEIIKQAPNEEFEIALITTDTAIAKVAAELIAMGLTKISDIKSIETKTVQNLQVENGKELSETGFNNLINCYDNIIEDTKRNNKNPKFILNVTGGYKGIIPLSTIYGLVAEISLNYIYEDSNSLVVLENIPLTFDWTIAELVGPYLDTYKFNEFKQDENIMAMLRHYGFVNKNNNISAFGFLFKRVLDKTQPEGKTSLGMLVEYKLYEYYYQFDKNVRSDYRVSRSINITENFNPNYPLKGNEVDILLEEDENCPIFINIWEHGNKNQIKPIANKYITNEVKGFWQVKSGNNLTQFKAFIKLLKENWEQPKEIRYVTWELIRANLRSVTESQIKNTLLSMKQMVIDELQADLFKPYLLTLRIDVDIENPYVAMMQKRIKKQDFKLIQL